MLAIDFPPLSPSRRPWTQPRLQGRNCGIGHWVSPGTDERYGTVYATALCCLMLENYYAYLPSFHEPPEAKAEEKDEDVEIEITL